MKKKFAIVLGVCPVQLIAAAICGHHSCEWGNGFYFFTDEIVDRIPKVLNSRPPSFHKL